MEQIWSLDADGDIQNACGDKIADMHITSDAHARLIAAAPELLDALLRISRAHESGNNGMYNGEAILCEAFASLARTAIAKATGEIDGGHTQRSEKA